MGIVYRLDSLLVKNKKMSNCPLSPLFPGRRPRGDDAASAAGQGADGGGEADVNTFVAAALLPSKLLQLLLAADELDSAVIEQDQAAFGIVIAERKQLRAAMLVPTGLRLE